MARRSVTPEQPVGTSPQETGDTESVPSRAPERGEHLSGLAIIASKVGPEVEGRSVLTRPRLAGWLDKQNRARVILVSAEAGYGKSTLLSDFSRRSGETCVWYRMETSDGDWITFLSYMVAAIRQAVPDFGRPTEALLRHVAAMGSSRELVLAQFLADLSGLGNTSMVVILDDYHLAEDSEDVRLIVGRLLERAPDGMRFILAGRGRPNLALGRLAAQGRVSELTTADLRFTRSEIDELFAVAYAQPLDRHAGDIVADRTQGWAASLQLVSASIAASRPSEVGPFIEALSGATGPIYDFLAEEVLTRMSPLTQRVLLHASLLDEVTPGLVTAALSVTPEPTDGRSVSALLEDARALGLLSDIGSDSIGARIHPLFRQFLEHQLGQEASPEQMRAMHMAVARAAENTAWLAAAKHYALAGEPHEAMRVLGSAASEALGTGAWGAAVEVIALMPDTPPPPAVEVIKARALTADGRPDDAIALLGSMDLATLDADERALLSLAKASALQMGGHSRRLWDEVRILGSLGHSDPIVNRLASAWALMRTACQGGSISAARRALDLLAAEASRASLGHFAGIALHNAATAALAQGEYEEAAQLAIRARTTLIDSPVDASIGPSTLITQALAQAELGNHGEGQSLALEATSAPDAHPDVLADAAYLATVCGDAACAQKLEHRLRRLLASGPAQVGAHQQAAVARVTRMVTTGQFEEAAASARRLTEGALDELDGYSRSAYLVALSSTLSGKSHAARDVVDALATIDAQKAWRWEFRVRLIEAAVRADAESLARWVADCGELSSLAILELADLIGASLHLLDPIPADLTRSMFQYPTRWRPVLLRQLRTAHASAPMAARLLTDYGTHEDASHLAAFERRTTLPGRKARFSRALVRRVSPTLRIHDLGRTTYEVAGVEARSSAARRKALALLLFLVTRPKQTATREQVMEDLWPNQTPTSASNSLHQTLHFVRRDIAPWQEGGATADYVPLDSELIYLDPDLVQVDSVAFMRQATEALNTPDLARCGPSVARLYSGRFAPEFEYEDWAEDWRTLLHAQFLYLSQATADALLVAERTQAAIDVLSRAIEIDGLAFNIRAMLIRTFNRAGALDAAADHYRHYANLTKRELGVRAPPLGELLRDETEA